MSESRIVDLDRHAGQQMPGYPGNWTDGVEIAGSRSMHHAPQLIAECWQLVIESVTECIPSVSRIPDTNYVRHSREFCEKPDYGRTCVYVISDNRKLSRR